LRFWIALLFSIPVNSLPLLPVINGEEKASRSKPESKGDNFLDDIVEKV
jgi:hypothetical protein